MDVFLQYFIAAGWLLYPLVACMFLIWLFYFLLLAELRGKLRTPDPGEIDMPVFPEDDKCASPAENKVMQYSGIVPVLIIGCLRLMRKGLAFREAFMQCRHAAISPYTYSFYMLGALVTAAPLLGLLGTVFGMIETFNGMGTDSTDTASQVAGGISQALITTQLGLVAALPGTFGLYHLFRLYRRLVNIIDQCESHMALKFEHAEPSP
ncbi:MAG: MotA/TolQ/ExbB proton channel family protein [Lentisphaeria bacterium]